MEIKHINDIDSERDVLGECMRWGRFADVSDIISQDTFFYAEHRDIYNAIATICERGDVPTPEQVRMEIPKVNPNSSVKWDFIQSLSMFTCDTLRQSVIRLNDFAQRRKITDIAISLLSKASNTGTQIEGIVEQAMDSIKGIEGEDARFQTLDDVLPQVYNLINDNLLGVSHTGTPTGFAYLDRKGGLVNSDLIVIAGETSQGKTSLATSMVLSALQSGASVGFFSMEMQSVQLAQRMVATKSGVSSGRIKFDKLTEQEVVETDNAMTALLNMQGKVYFDQRSNSNIDTILASIRMMHARYGIEGVVVDYLQILNCNMRNANKEQAMGDIARRLKNIAKELDIWVIALSQLNRDNLNPEPSIARLRDSGQIAEAADMVLLVYRPEYYNKPYSNDFEQYETHETAEIKVAKGRNVGVGHFLCGFNPATTSFYELKSYPVRIGRASAPSDPF